ncbi:hypothetical protein ABPG75_000092 [Micractinium tetrahymenae]
MASLAVCKACASVAPRRCALFKRPISVPRRSQFASTQQKRAGGFDGRPSWVTAVAAAAEGGDWPNGGAAAKTPTKAPIKHLIKCFLVWSPFSGAVTDYDWTEQDAVNMLAHLLGGIQPEATSAKDLMPVSLGDMLLMPSAVSLDDSAPIELRCPHLVDGEQRVLTLCLLLAAARSRLLGAGDSACGQLAQKVERLLQTGGSAESDTTALIEELELQGSLPEQLRSQLCAGQNAVFLRRLLLDPACQPGEGELSEEARRRLWANLQLFRNELSGMELRQVQLMVELILKEATATLHTARCLEDVMKYAQAYQTPASLLSFWLPQHHMPVNLTALAYSADLIVSLDSCDMPLALHSSMLASESKVLGRAIAAHAGDTTAQAAAVERAFEGHAPAEAKCFLRLLYTIALGTQAVEAYGAHLPDEEQQHMVEVIGFVVARGVPEAALDGVAELAHKLGAHSVLQLCGVRLVQLLRNAGDAELARWLPLAERCGFDAVRYVAAIRCTDAAQEQQRGGSRPGKE